MSNRLSFAHLALRRGPQEWLPAPQPRLAVRALRWVRDAIAPTVADLPPAMQRDLGLPETAPAVVAFAYEVERSRVRV